MTENSNNTADFEVFKVISYEEILRLALENLERKNKTYFSLIKNYILNYEKTEIKIRNKLKNTIVFIQNQIKKYGIKRTMKNLNNKLDKLGIMKNKDIYFRLYLACIKYSESEIIND